MSGSTSVTSRGGASLSDISITPTPSQMTGGQASLSVSSTRSSSRSSSGSSTHEASTLSRADKTQDRVVEEEGSAPRELSCWEGFVSCLATLGEAIAYFFCCLWCGGSKAKDTADGETAQVLANPVDGKPVAPSELCPAVDAAAVSTDPLDHDGDGTMVPADVAQPLLSADMVADPMARPQRVKSPPAERSAERLSEVALLSAETVEATFYSKNGRLSPAVERLRALPSDETFDHSSEEEEFIKMMRQKVGTSPRTPVQEAALITSCAIVGKMHPLRVLGLLALHFPKDFALFYEKDGPFFTTWKEKMIKASSDPTFNQQVKIFTGAFKVAGCPLDSATKANVRTSMSELNKTANATALIEMLIKHVKVQTTQATLYKLVNLATMHPLRLMTFAVICFPMELSALYEQNKEGPFFKVWKEKMTSASTGPTIERQITKCFKEFEKAGHSLKERRQTKVRERALNNPSLLLASFIKYAKEIAAKKVKATHPEPSRNVN